MLSVAPREEAGLLKQKKEKNNKKRTHSGYKSQEGDEKLINLFVLVQTFAACQGFYFEKPTDMALSLVRRW